MTIFDIFKKVKKSRKVNCFKKAKAAYGKL